MSRVIVAENAGFCPGVRAATVAVEQRMRDRRPGETLAVLGQLIHNETYLRMLESAGVRTVKEEELPALAAGARRAGDGVYPGTRRPLPDKGDPARACRGTSRIFFCGCDLPVRDQNPPDRKRSLGGGGRP